MTKLSVQKVRSLREPGRYGDGGNLWLQVGGTGTKAWVFRYSRAGQARHLGLGSLDLVSLSEAREKAFELRKQLLSGTDPLAARRAQRAKAASTITFKDAAEQYVQKHRSAWRSEKHANQWLRSLEQYAFATMGALPVGAIDTPHVLKVLEPIWAVKMVTADRVRNRIESVLNWARARGYRTGDNPAEWRGHLKHLLAEKKTRKVEHHPALPYEEAPQLIREIRARQAPGLVSPRALEFLFLTGVRLEQLIAARKKEFDRQNAVWTIPASRTKKLGWDFKVPLCSRALQLLEELPREARNEFVFVGEGNGSHISASSVWRALKEGMKREDLTPHGFRSTFRTWAAEQTNFAWEICEIAIGHKVGDKTTEAYMRGDLFEKRCRLANEWARYCATPSVAAGNVRKIRA